MKPALLTTLLLACAAVHPDTMRAQVASDSACSYSQCALRIDYGFFSTRLVRGSSGQSVARLGWFGGGVGVLLAASDSAAYYARQYRSRRTTSDALGVLSAGLALVALTQTDDFMDGTPLLVAGITLELVALPFWLSSRRNLDRAVWWYNRDLPRP
jgi:hypothetical protein